MRRMDVIDIVRGFAILQMVFWQVFDFFASKNIYSDTPFFIRTFNMPPHFSVLIMFLSMSGAGMMLSLQKRARKKLTTKQVLTHAVKKYGPLILISLAFTTLMWNFCTFQTWGEVIQGIGLTAIIAALVFAVKPSKKTLSIVIVGLVIAQPVIKPMIFEATRNIPPCPAITSKDFIPSLVLNASLRGFFSPLNLLPLFLIGALLVQCYQEAKDKRKLATKLFKISVLLIVLSLTTHAFGFRINFYERTVPSLMLETGALLLVFSLYILLSKTLLQACADKILIPYGRNSLICYLSHFIFVLKPLQLLRLENTFSNSLSLIAALFFIIILNVVFTKWTD